MKDEKKANTLLMEREMSSVCRRPIRSARPPHTKAPTIIPRREEKQKSSDAEHLVTLERKRGEGSIKSEEERELGKKEKEEEEEEERRRRRRRTRTRTRTTTTVASLCGDRAPKGSRVSAQGALNELGAEEDAVPHQRPRQAQCEVKRPLELPVAALLQDGLVLLGQLLLVLPPLRLVGRQIPELRLGGLHAVHAARLPRLGSGDALVLPFVDLIVLVVTFSGVAVTFIVIGPAVIAMVSVVVACRHAAVVVVIVFLLKAFIGALGVLVGHFVRAAPHLLADLFLGHFGDVLGAADKV
ncbi:hypothetical protein F7725_018268 [Dissostichus mawsoni]|uniref:Uncharacterized protein n=1 Tax=Dissostichus mawsoni TaxID=36200 RepID=A0A7J5XRR7_DISMA|nr:hypothetical protein F7725_018268 [Dissostichus mawsoni]